jgi:tRNA pseudouridine55 synthase
MKNISLGLYPFFKPSGIHTYDLIRIIKRKLNKKNLKIGHGGSLDPIAEGVVVVGIGREYTKQLNKILNFSEKEYITEILLNIVSDTHDISGKVEQIEISNIPSYEEVKKTIESFIGEIEQIPPIFSAKKVAGRRICDLIREGKISSEEAKSLVKPKKVKIYNIEILEYNFPKLLIKVLCSSGTYIRSLARDIGEKLGCGGVVSKIIRTRVDNFRIEDAIKIEE